MKGLRGLVKENSIGNFAAGRNRDTQPVRPPWITGGEAQMASGRTPDGERLLVEAESVAGKLSRLCRFAGHSVPREGGSSEACSSSTFRRTNSLPWPPGRDLRRPSASVPAARAESD